MKVFSTADILIPKAADMTKWSCIACDQFTSEPEYWADADRIVADSPGALRLVLPEAYLSVRDNQTEMVNIYKNMNNYVNQGLFEELKDSYVYVERRLPSGALRRGLVGKLDLECYDWAEGTKTPVRSTEFTVASRLPARKNVRMGAELELPHIMVFIDDPQNSVIPSASGGDLLYDFDLMLGGGHIRGSRVQGEHAQSVTAAIEALGGDPAFAMGDGNHGLAAAKLCWEEEKAGLSESEREGHPLRYALVELVNIHDEAVTFEPIHRVLSGTKTEAFFAEAERFFPLGDEGHRLILAVGGVERSVRVSGLTIGQLVSETDRFLTSYTAKYGGETDYIHGDDETRELAARPNAAAILLPRLEKPELFPSVAESGPFPKKSFSIGHARDKRYYLECRKIR